LKLVTTMAKRPGNNNKANRDPLRFDVATLREFAGEKVFARGVAYHEDGQVEIVSIDSARVVARVIGSEVYRSQLDGLGKKLSGECSCQAFADRGFCKHLVATALAANDLQPGELEKTAGRLTKIRDFLRAKGVELLVEMITGLAERDPELLREIELAAMVATADDQTLFVQFKKAITEATRMHGFVEYREARAWAAKIERVLEQIEAMIQSGRADLILRLLDHFYARMDDALNNIDDSDGQGGGVYAKACEIHLAACRASKPEPVALAREMFGREVDSDWDFFHGASETYADVLGDAGLAEYRRLANEAWRTIKPLRAGGRQVHDDQSSARYRLGAVLECFAARDGDVDARIAIRAKDLSTAYAYLGIAQLCLSHGRDAEALKWAEEGLWQFEDHPDQRLVFFSADLYRRIGREKDADELLWQTFERLPSIELYRRLKSAASSGKAAVATVCDRVFELLRAKLDKSEAKVRWSSPRELLLQVLVSEKRLDEAWEVVRGHGCSEPQLVELAKASEQSHPDAALSAYAQSVERLVGLGGQPNYQEASELIAHMQSIRERLDASAEHAGFIADFMRRHKAKRNMMKLLQAKHDS
jgi:uncharacterized Zn finger protein